MSDNDIDAAEFTAELDHAQATLDDYHDLMEDRPIKFTAAQCGFSPKPKFKEVCDDCIHFFRGKVAHRNVCEIYRPEDDGSVAPMGWCRFWTDDYKAFPLIDKETHG